MKNIVKLVIAGLVFSCSAAFASGRGDAGGGSLLVYLFLGFGALIIAFQMVPGLILFFSMMKGIFSREPKKSAVAGAGSDRSNNV